MLEFDHQIEVFTTCPQSRDARTEDYLRRVAETASWSDEIGCCGILVYTDNSIVDPWLVAQIILQHTERLCPLVAIQPIYMHPYTAAKMVASLAFMHGRRIYLNMLAGGFRNDLAALSDSTPHDDRYRRTTEYTLVMKALLESVEPVSFEGRYYCVRGLRMTPSLPSHLFPGILISGSSAAGMQAAAEIGALGVEYPQPIEKETGSSGDRTVRRGARIGIIARDDEAEAWRIAHERFPDDRRGRLAHQLAMHVSDSVWHRQLSARAETVSPDSTYWLWPFQQYQTFCPYLVGSTDRVATELRGYITKGYRTFILDIPPTREELEMTRAAFAVALNGIKGDVRAAQQ